MDWDKHREKWPHAEASRFVRCRPHVWHVQELGDGPTYLLVHGAGGATHSWRALFGILSEKAKVIAIDLPGQGFTRMGSRSRSGLDEMSQDIAALCTDQDWQPDVIIGHSAGAAIALRLAQELDVKGVVGINAALGRFQGIAGWLFPILARLLALNPFVPGLFAKLTGNERRVRELLKSTGSELDEQGIRLYQTLISDRAHVDGALSMMAQWNVDDLIEGLSELNTPVLLITGEGDLTVPPSVSRRAASRLPDARYVNHPKLGHLIHEEAPELLAQDILAFAEALRLKEETTTA